MQPARSKVIPVDFAARRRARVPSSCRPPSAPPLHRRPQALAAARDFVLFWRPPSRRSAAEYLGGRWDWGWTLFVWTERGGGRAGVDRAHRRARLRARSACRARRWRHSSQQAKEIGGLLLDGELEGAGDVIRAEPDQLIRREDALSALAR